MKINMAMSLLDEGHTLTRKKWRRGRVIRKRATAPPDEPLIMQTWNSGAEDLTADDWELTKDSRANPFRYLKQSRIAKVTREQPC